MTNEELAVCARAGDENARNQLWEAVRRLCYKLAHRFFPLCRRAGIERADLEQELFFGFLAALDAFDPDKGYLFTAYLDFAIRNVCANALGIRNGKRLEPPASLQMPVGEDCDELQDLIPDTMSGQPFERIEDRIFIEQLRTVLDACLTTLEQTQQAVIRARFYDQLTQAQTGSRLNIPVERARQLEQSGLQRLRRSKAIQRLASFREHSVFPMCCRGAS